MKGTILQLKALFLVIVSLSCVTLSVAQSDLKWELVGPNNVGGSVRAVLYDNMDPKGFTMYAGGSNGGLLKGVTTKEGTSWTRIATTVDGQPISLNISCMLQTEDGKIYIGTGAIEDTLRGYPVFGKGIYIYKGSGVCELVPGTKPSLENEEWKFINAMQVVNGKIWAATNNGLVFQNANNDWVYAKGDFKTIDADGNYVVGDDRNFVYEFGELRRNATEVKIAGDVVLAYVDDMFYTGKVGDENFVVNKSMSAKLSNPSAKDKYPHHGLMKFAVGQTNENIVYAMRLYPYIIKPESSQKVKSIHYAFYMSIDKGASWNLIIKGNSAWFAPYFGVSDNSNSNPDLCNWTMSSSVDAVFATLPGDDNSIIFGSNYLGLGKRFAPGTNDYAFSWPGNISIGGSLLMYNPYYVHENVYSIAKNPFNKNEFIVGTAGGVSIATITNGIITFKTVSRGLDITDFNAISYTSDGSILGGTIDNGLQYFDKSENMGKASKEFYGYYTNSGSYSSNSFCMSSMFDNVMFVRGIHETTGSPALLRTETKGVDFAIKPLLYVNQKVDKDSVPMPMLPTSICLWESINDFKSIDSIQFTTLINYKEGDSIWLQSNSQGYPILYRFEKDYPIGTTIKVQDIVSSKAFFTWSQDANTFNTYMVRGVDNFKLEPTPIAMERFKQYDGRYVGVASNVALSANGDSYYIMTSNGFLIRISGLRGVYDRKTLILRSTAFILDISKNFNAELYGKYGKDVRNTSICIDPTKEERVILTFNKPITFEGADGVSNIFLCENTFSESPVFKAITGMEKYSILSTMFYAQPDAQGVISEDVNRLMIGTTLGLMYTENLSDPNPSWSYSGDIMGKVPVTSIKQQLSVRNKVNYITNSPISPKPNVWEAIKNSFDVYASTYGNGVFTMKSSKSTIGINDNLDSNKPKSNKLDIYPNPVTNGFKICFDEDISSKVISVNLVDMSGKAIDINGFSVFGNILEVYGIESVDSGMYMVKVVTKDGVYSGKIIKKVR